MRGQKGRACNVFNEAEPAGALVAARPGRLQGVANGYEVTREAVVL